MTCGVSVKIRISWSWPRLARALSIDQVKKEILWKHGLVSRVTKVRGEMEG